MHYRKEISTITVNQVNSGALFEIENVLFMATDDVLIDTNVVPAKRMVLCVSIAKTHNSAIGKIGKIERIDGKTEVTLLEAKPLVVT